MQKKLAKKNGLNSILILAVTVAAGVGGAIGLIYVLDNSPGQHWWNKTRRPNSSIDIYTFSKEYKPVVVMPRPFPAITKFPIKKVDEVEDQINPSELVLAVTVAKESRAYPINMLTGPQREILNDELGGKAIAATW